MKNINRPLTVVLTLIVSMLLLAACQILISPTDLSAPVQLRQPSASEDTPQRVTTWMPRFNEQGEVVRPDDFGFREEWVYIGTPLTPNDLNNGSAPFPEFHNVYMDPASFQHFKERGEVPDGAMIVKELISVGDTNASSGNGYFMGDFQGLELALKSSARFPDEPGNWAYFSWTNEDEEGGPLKNATAAFPTESCNSCHAMFAEYDHIFAQYYPVLRAANPAIFASLNDGFPDEMMAAVAATMADTMATPPATSEEMATFVDEEALAAITVEDQLPRGAENLLPYLQESGYSTWLPESEIHPSTGPHGNVRSFMNSVLEASIAAGNAEHPAGSAMVKELYDDDAETLIGWAAYVKTQDEAAGGKGWYWYENFSTVDNSELVADGNGASLCVSCHTLSRNDYVLSNVPFE